MFVQKYLSLFLRNIFLAQKKILNYVAIHIHKFKEREKKFKIKRNYFFASAYCVYLCVYLMKQTRLITNRFLCSQKKSNKKKPKQFKQITISNIFIINTPHHICNWRIHLFKILSQF